MERIRIPVRGMLNATLEVAVFRGKLRTMSDGLHPVTRTVVILTAIASVILTTWCTVIAFKGGTLPLIGIELKGGVGNGLVWLFIIDPIALTVCYWFSMLLILLTAPLSTGRSDDGYETDQEERGGTLSNVCGAPTRSGLACTRVVTDGGRCHQHREL